MSRPLGASAFNPLPMSSASGQVVAPTIQCGRMSCGVAALNIRSSAPRTIRPRARPMARRAKTMRSNWVMRGAPCLIPHRVANAAHRVGEAAGAGDRHSRAAVEVGRPQGAAEPQLGGLLQPRIHAADRADLARKADLA